MKSCIGLGAFPRIGDVGIPARLRRPRPPRVTPEPLASSPPVHGRLSTARRTMNIKASSPRRGCVGGSVEYATRAVIRAPRVLVVVLYERGLIGARLLRGRSRVGCVHEKSGRGAYFGVLVMYEGRI